MEAGTRVFVVSSHDELFVWVIGYGTYLGDEVEQIKLDSGEVVWVHDYSVWKEDDADTVVGNRRIRYLTTEGEEVGVPPTEDEIEALKELLAAEEETKPDEPGSKN